MKRKARKGAKWNSGYTMAEMLVVVAVTVVLLGISMLAISNLFINLKMKELDDYAKTIYLEAQNQLSAKEVEGGLDRYYEQFKEDYESRFLTTIPQDYSYNNNDENWKSLCYVTKRDEITKTLIVEQSNIYQSDGHYVIELNPQTGDIYGVFYWESNEPIPYEDIENLVDRSQKERAEMKVGYYGGMANSTTAATVVLDQQVELINAEELYLKVSYDASARLLRYYNSALTIEYFISNEAGTVTWQGEMDVSNMKETAGRLECYMLLDSMAYSFAEISQGSGLLPGENLSIVVRSIYERGSDYCVESSEQEPVFGNSLFGDCTTEDTIEIANLRHLRNLDADYVDSGLYPSENDEGLTIQLTKDIDFQDNNYAWNITRAEDGSLQSVAYIGVGKGQRPMESLTPIGNNSLLSGCTITGDYDGNLYKFKNFVVKAGAQREGVGLFASARNVTFTNITIEDITVDGVGYDNVGALVGTATGGRIENCGVYLSTYEDSNGAQNFYSKQADATGVYSNEMERRYDTFKVTGKRQAGGLVGTANGTNITDSFAAIKVEVSGNTAGGLTGSINGGSIVNSYASGDVTGNGGIGGLVGNLSSGVITDAYATGNVYGEDKFGGFLGASSNSILTNCTSYGEVLKKDMGILSNAKAGGFVYVSNASGNTYNNCKYMTQTGYNKNGLSDPQVVADNATNYKNLLTAATGNTLGVGSTYPYADTLFGMIFPFAKLPNQSQHYGNWPGEYAIDTSLVYYEKYADGKYGYYCVTYIADDEHTWLLNTLRDEICVEDGYALMTKYNLTEFNFDLYIGYSDTGATPNYSSDTARMDDDVSVSDAAITVVDISRAEAGTSDKYKHAFRLVQQGKLEFEGYPMEAYDSVTGQMDSDAEVEDAFSVNGMYIYQLPYDLQTTDRYGIANFYDRLVIRDAKAKGSDTIVIDDRTFFYCPHFAKAAVNLADTEGQINESGTITYEPRTNPTNVFVRSARQLNALGRFPYYWNDEGGSGDIVFLQETDINFSTYATGHVNGEKLYCGQEFDLTKFGTEYANQPIGQPDIDSSDSINYQQFKNSYNGQCNVIYDYCIDSSRQFVGLFGEIKEAEVRNVMMLISEKPTGDAGVINGTYQDLHKYGTGGNRKRTGVGALVGLDYDGANVIDNCVSKGYTVKYTINAITDSATYRQPVGIAVGGLLGFGMSDISNCAAVNDVRVIVNTHYDRNAKAGLDGATFLGGFAGSYFYNTITNCYSGGTLDVEWNGYAVFRLRIGGFCPGAMDTPAERFRIGSSGVQYVNIYSYTELDEDVWEIGKGTLYDDGNYDDFGWYFPLVSRMYCTYTSDPSVNWLGKVTGGWTTDRKSGASPSSGVSVPGFAYYITEHQEEHIARLESVVKGYFQEDGDSYPQTCEGATYAELSSVEILREYFKQKLTNDGYTFLNFGRANAKNTHPDSKRLKKIAYPYPAFVKNDKNEYVHYGDWLTAEEEVAGNYPLYFEEYADGSYGVYYLAVDKNALGEESIRVENHLVMDDSKEIVHTGYGYMSLQEVEGKTPVFDYDIQSGHDGGTYNYMVYAFTEEELYAAAGSTSTEAGNEREIVIPFTYETMLASIGESIKVVESSVKKLYVNPKFAAAISMADNELGTESTPLQVRTPEQFANLSAVHESNVYMLQTHSIDLSKGHTPVDVLYSHVFDGGSDKGFAICNATDVLFTKNEGTIQNMSVTGSRIDVEDNVSIVVNSNVGTASNITVKDARMTSSAIAAGFTLINTGSINKVSIIAENAYKDVQIKGYRAHGFVGQNDGVITNSLVTGTIEGASRAAGFAAINTNKIQYCYANVHVGVTETHAQTAGFVLTSTTSAENLKFCYASGSVEGYEAFGFMCEGKANSCYTISNINGAYMYGFAGDAATNQVENCYWGYDEKANFNMAIYNHPMGIGEAIALGRLMRGDAGGDYAEDVSQDVPYNTTLGTEYPYPSVGLIHYGDWQPPSVEKQNTRVETNILNDRWKEAGLFYYERYMDGSYGIYAIGMTRYNNDNPSVMINTLAAADEPVLASGYGIFYQDTRWNIQRWDDGWWYGEHDITYYNSNYIEDFILPHGVDDHYKFRYITESEEQENYVCTFTYGNNGEEKTILINSGYFNRPE